jgi:hypothetical protein
MIKPLIIRLYRPDEEGLCVYEDEGGRWQGGVFMPVGAVLQLCGDPFAYFEAWPMNEGELEIGRRLPDQGW